MPVKKSIGSKRTASATKASRLESLRSGSRNGAAPIAVAVLCVMAAAMVIATYEPSGRAEGTTAENPAAERPQAPTVTTAAALTPVAMNASEEPAATGVPAAAPVTISGCLERTDATFRLKDAAGTDVPRGRSWKSGFLKKSTASIQLVDASSRVRLKDHVGRRVSVTGTLVDREMRVRSLQRVAATCGGKTKAKA